MGDFNEVLMSDDKFSGRPVTFRCTMKFQNFLDTCGMMDMGFSGNRLLGLIQEVWQILSKKEQAKAFVTQNGGSCI